MDKDRIEAKEQVKQLKFKDKIKHYCYYYKFHFVVVLVVVLLFGGYIYQKATEVDADLDISVFLTEYISLEKEEKMEELFADWIETDSQEKIVSVSITNIPDADDFEKTEVASAGYTKLDGQLAAGTVQALIFDEKIYDNIMEFQDYAQIKYDKYSGEITEDAKEKLGLDKSKKYYYVTRILYNNEKDDETAIEKQQRAMQIYFELCE